MIECVKVNYSIYPRIYTSHLVPNKRIEKGKVL